MINDPNAEPSHVGNETVFHANTQPPAKGTVSCPKCGRSIEFTSQQVGMKVGCPHCPGVMVRAGRSLLDADQSCSAVAAIDRPFSVLIPYRYPWKRSTIAAGALLLAGLAVAAAVWLTALHLPGLAPGWLTWQSVPAEDAELPQGTQEREGPAGLPPPEITLQQIEELEKWPDREKALLRAQVWLQILQDHGLADQRTEELEAMIARLEEELRPEAEPPPEFLRAFRQALKGARDALAVQDLRKAGVAVAQAEQLLSDHPDELAAYGRSFLAIKQRYEQLRLSLEGRERMRELLAQAEASIRAEKPTEAAEQIAEAMFMALGTPMDDTEYEERDVQVRHLRQELRFILGKRAVDDANECHRQNDLRARDAQLQVALDLLPDLPSDRVAGLLKTARELAEEAIPNPVDSELGRELDFRAAYETALEYYGRRGGLLELAERCTEAQRLLEAAPHLGPEPAEKLERLITSALDFAMRDALALPGNSSEAPRVLVLVRDALKAASHWQNSPKYRYVQEALLSKEDELAANAIRLATRKAGSGRMDDLANAIQIVEPAMSLGSADSRRRASSLAETWRQQVQQLNRQQLEKEAWEELVGLSHNRRYIEAWIGLDEFEEQFRDSPRKADIPAVRKRLLPLVQDTFAKDMSAAQAHYERAAWPEFRRIGKLLLRAPLPAQQRQQLAWIEEEIVRLDKQAREHFASAERYRRMLNDREVVELLKHLKATLHCNPDHGEATELLKKAKQKAESLAQGFMLRARKVGPQTPSIYRKHLDRVIQLDEGGKLGTQAMDMLAELDR